ncbi:hypothetical protein L7F22_060587 [Adiantum nelumboides]|nr:hypothetical protein [Adiantum nelumboides]
MQLLESGLKVKEYELIRRNFSDTGYFGFVIHIDMGIKYDPSTSIYGMEFFVVLERVGYKVEQDKRAVVIRALGESDSAKLISEETAQIDSLALIELHHIEASREIAGTLAKTPNVMYIPEVNNMMLVMNSLLK